MSTTSSPDPGWAIEIEGHHVAAPKQTLEIMEEPATYRHIVVAIDGTRESQAALEHAARLALSSNACLDLLAVATVPSTTYWGGAAQPVELVEQLYADIVRRAAASVPDLPVTTYLARGRPATAIRKHAVEHDCDLIVMGTR